MKKILAILMSVCMLLGMTACSSGTGDASVAKTEESVWSLNDTATLKTLKVTAVDFKETKGENYFEAEDGNVFVGVKFEIENISDEAQNVSSLLLFDAYADDVKCDYSFSANMAFGDGTLDGEVEAGKKLVGWYAVEIPEEWKTLELGFKSDWLSGNKAKFVFEK